MGGSAKNFVYMCVCWGRKAWFNTWCSMGRGSQENMKYLLNSRTIVRRLKNVIFAAKLETLYQLK